MPDFDTFGWVAQALLTWPPRDWPDAVAERTLARAIDALYVLSRAPDRVGRPDLTALFRQILRRESVLQGTDQTLVVPATSSWPTRDEWAQSGVTAVPGAAGWMTIRARAWRPAWLIGSSGTDPSM